ncbi:MAG: DUF1926 domain-containing protein [Planctomycetia bacterium]|nr:DUF1926 domain-containing protein [Planctomycetia bacterium]
MTKNDPVRFVLAIHNHQPVGNFGWTIEQAYQDSYLPFLDVFSQPKYASIKMSLHNSGCLMDWLEINHPEYLDRLAKLVAEERVEILGGTYYEAILGMLPSRDRIGQIQRFTNWLTSRLGAKIRGMWMPERVWEASFVRDIVSAGIEYTIVDDFHLKKAGLKDEQLYGYVVTEDDGAVMGIFPGSENFRYWIPFHDPQESIQYMQKIRQTHPHAILVFGDDGEKFGTWPETHQHVYGYGWLEKFFDALLENADDIRCVTLAEAYDEVTPLQKLYLPDCSYREMTEWSLPAERLTEYENAIQILPQNDPQWNMLKTFITGGNWRNFKVKYPETNEMYARMMYVSRRLMNLEKRVTQNACETPEGEISRPQLMEMLEEARGHLYRGQCNCPYWHGAFGGVYLPVLRDAIYRHLITADLILDKIKLALDGSLPRITKEVRDFDFDHHDEIRIANDFLVAWISPQRGGTLYELDLLRIPHNLLATLARRKEAYHQKIVQYHNASHEEDVSSIHQRVVFKQKGLEKFLQYDSYLRKSMTDLFFSPGTTLDRLFYGEILPQSDFAAKEYTASAEILDNACEVILRTSGKVIAQDSTVHPIQLTKILTLPVNSCSLRIRYHLENLPHDAVFHFGSEFHFSGLPANCKDRFFYNYNPHEKNPERHTLGHLGTRLDLVDATQLGIIDEWLNLDIHFQVSRPARMWTYPVETVSNSEGGFEMVHQSVAVVPNWFVQGDENGKWETEIEISFPSDTL